MRRKAQQAAAVRVERVDTSVSRDRHVDEPHVAESGSLDIHQRSSGDELQFVKNRRGVAAVRRAHDPEVAAGRVDRQPAEIFQKVRRRGADHRHDMMRPFVQHEQLARIPIADDETTRHRVVRKTGGCENGSFEIEDRVTC